MSLGLEERTPIDTDRLAPRILEVLRNSGGHSRLSLIADAIGEDPASVNYVLAQMQSKKLIRQSGAWWRITDKGERVPPETPSGNGVRRATSRPAVTSGIDYGIVLDDLRRRRDQLDAAISAIEQLQA